VTFDERRRARPHRSLVYVSTDDCSAIRRSRNSVKIHARCVSVVRAASCTARARAQYGEIGLRARRDLCTRRVERRSSESTAQCGSSSALARSKATPCKARSDKSRCRAARSTNTRYATLVAFRSKQLRDTTADLPCEKSMCVTARGHRARRRADTVRGAMSDRMRSPVGGGAPRGDRGAHLLRSRESGRRISALMTRRPEPPACGPNRTRKVSALQHRARDDRRAAPSAVEEGARRAATRPPATRARTVAGEPLAGPPGENSRRQRIPRGGDHHGNQHHQGNRVRQRLKMMSPVPDWAAWRGGGRNVRFAGRWSSVVG
jgi:hypothetical protein